MADKLLSSARYAGGADVQAFPLGGHVTSATLSSAAPRAFAADELPPSGSLFYVDIPDGRTLFYGHVAQVGGLSGDAARARMFRFPGGTQRLFVLDDEHQGGAVFLADGSTDMTVRILEAAYVGGGA